MKDKKTKISEILIKTRDARLLLEMACWVHDLDKASWPFSLFNIQNGKEKNYQHELQPSRSENSEEWTWHKNWLNDKVESNLSHLLELQRPLFEGLVPNDGAKICLVYNDRKKQESFLLSSTDKKNTGGSFPDLFQYHSAYKDINNQPWEQWLISSPFAGPDGIDSHYFKGGLKGDVGGVPQSVLPIKVATPFGYEIPVLGNSDNLQEFKKQNEQQFKEIFKTAFCWTKDFKETQSIPWEELKARLKKKLESALGFTNRPTNDVNLWAHSYGVGTMTKAIAASIALDSVVAKENGAKYLISPLRSPERNLLKDENKKPTEQLHTGFFVPQDLDQSKTSLYNQVQTKFKVLSVLLRDSDRLHVGRKVGDILGYHSRRNELFSVLASVIEKELAVGSEIFRDHAGIHFLLPWCQDSLDAHLDEKALRNKEKNTSRKEEDLRTQELLEKMMLEVVDYIFRGSETPPEWLRGKIDIKDEIRKAADFDVVVEIGPSREPLMQEADVEKQKKITQGLLFLKNNTRITTEIDSKFPRQLPKFPPEQFGNRRSIALCPICRKRPSDRSQKRNLQDDSPCKTCRDRRESRANIWWNELCESRISRTTIWSAEASDNQNRVNLLTIAFDLGRWFKGDAFKGYIMPLKTGYMPVHSVPARIRGVWEASLDFLITLMECVHKEVGLNRENRLVFDVKPTLSQEEIKKWGKNILISDIDETSELGDWFLGKDVENRFRLLNVSGWSAKKDEKGDLWLIKNGVRKKALNDKYKDKLISRLTEIVEQEVKFQVKEMDLITDEEENFTSYTPIVEILTDSPTRFQVLAPADKTVEILNLINDFFLEHFGKVAHNIEFCVNCLTFKEKFPFYLALEAADRFVQLELERAKINKRVCMLDKNGLAISFDDKDPARDFFEDGYKWKCLDKDHRDIYRSTVALASKNEKDSKEVFVGWKKGSGVPLIKIERKEHQLTEDETFEPPKAEDGISDNFNVCCPRLSWAHLASPAERFEEQLSIPLLAFEDWLDAYNAAALGSRGRDCKNCIKSLGPEDVKLLPEKSAAPMFQGFKNKPTQFRNLIEEILDAHVLWPADFRHEKKPEELKEHIQSLICHPNGCGPAWKTWAEMRKCPVMKNIENLDKSSEIKEKLIQIKNDKAASGCIDFANDFYRSINRFETIARNNKSRALSITYDLLNKLCSYKMNKISFSDNTGGENELP